MKQESEFLKGSCPVWPPLAAPFKVISKWSHPLLPGHLQELLIGPCPSSYIRLVFTAYWQFLMPDPHNEIGYNYACCDIMGLDINILATREQGLFLSTVYHLAVVHPLLAERREELYSSQR